jgi:hypothetical protein
MEWFDCSIPLCPPGGLDSKEFNAMEDMFHIQVKDKIFGEGWLECFATQILDAKYEKADVAEVMKGLAHLNTHQKADLLWVLQENDKMFNETLGVYPHKKMHIDIDPNAKPVHSRPYPVPQIHLKTFKKELNHLDRIGILAAQQESEWASRHPHSLFLGWEIRSEFRKIPRLFQFRTFWTPEFSSEFYFSDR